MIKYNITAERVNGTQFTDTIYAADEKAARRDFNEIYRHADKSKIINIVALGDGYQASKAQEREAIAEIRRIISTLGESSYVATAFEGCFDDAEQNIENDFALSMYSRWQSAEQKVSHLEAKLADLKDKLSESEKDYEAAHAAAHEIAEQKDAEIKALQAQVVSQDDICDLVQLLSEKRFELDTEVKNAAERIVETAAEPESAGFKNAVKDHRAAKSNLEHYTALLCRVSKIQGE